MSCDIEFWKSLLSMGMLAILFLIFVALMWRVVFD